MPHDLTPLEAIEVPAPPRDDEVHRTRFLGKTYEFRGLKGLLGAADFDKAGDRHAGLAAGSEAEREAARGLLSALTLGYLYDRPLTDERGRVDEVMRAGYDVDRAAFAGMRAWTVGGCKDALMKAPGEEAGRIGRALTPVMAAAVAKIMDVHELVYAARKIRRPTRARTRLGLPGTLASRLQPNHPVDDPRGITLLTYAGLSLASGDALLGVNPAVDTVANVSAILELLDRLRRQTGAPSQICVLAHVKTQLSCLEAGAPVEIMFQSLAGTESTLVSEFDCTVALLDRAWSTMRERGPLGRAADHFMYFETGQGSEFTYGKHEGMDMTTAEALCYGLARRYDPFMVNNVTGFIGPETHLDNFEMLAANLQDHFMGKLLGLPMGMAPCYTLHSRITLEGQQSATQLLTAAGANYYMDVCLNTDRMLAYFDTSGHDVQTLREIHGRTPCPEYLEWALDRKVLARTADGTVERGPAWGDPERFATAAGEVATLAQATPALHGWATAGPRPADAVERAVRLHQAVARQAISAELDLDALAQLGACRVVRTQARDRDHHLSSPDAGSRLEDAGGLGPEASPVQVVLSDGLSAEAVNANAPELVPLLLEGLAARGHRAGRPLVAPLGRVKLAEALADALDARLIVMLIGERPGGDAQAARSLSAYLAYRLTEDGERAAAAQFSGNAAIRFEYTVVSNIHAGGLPPAEAASVLVERAGEILSRRAAGNRLEALLRGGGR